MMRIVVAAVVILLVSLPVNAEAQGGRCGFGNWDGNYYAHQMHQGNIPYDGRFTMARVQYAGDFRCGGEGPGWSHDYPEAEHNFMKILRELTVIRPHMERFNILRLDSPDLFKYPAVYFSEPGGWYPNEAEVRGLRAYLQKGGFLIFDDFEAQPNGRGGTNDYANFIAQMRRVIPDVEVFPIDLKHPIFDSFFHITEPWKSGSGYGGNNGPEFYGIFEDNDQSKRIIAVLNYRNDLGENWQFSATGMVPLDQANESWRLGINYYIYALTR